MGDQTAAPSLTAQVEAVIARIRPFIRADGGEVELAGVNEEQGIVFVRLSGTCAT